MNKEYLPVRLSHLIRHCSVGAIVRGPKYLIAVKDIRYWIARDGTPGGRIIPYVDQVRSALAIEQELRVPPTAKELENKQVDGICIPAVRFPSWMRCPTCGLLYYKPWKGVQANESPRCREPNKKKCRNQPELEQAPWVMVHSDGHMADAPWHYMAHANPTTSNQEQCRSDWSEPYLKISNESYKRFVVCTRCKARGDFPDSPRVPFNNRWRQPWISEPPDATDNPAIVMEINDARVYSPVTNNALVIPPESRIRKGSVVDRLYSSSRKQRQIEHVRNSLARKSAMSQIASEFRCSLNEIEDALKEIKRGYPLYGKNVTQGILLEKEYKALLEKIPDVMDDEDFVTQHQTYAWKAKASELTKGTIQYCILNSIDHLIGVSRLKEIMVFKGFQRKVGCAHDKDEEASLVPPDIVGQSAWLPALELYGEGIFFNIDEVILSGWENHPVIKKRAENFLRRFMTTGLKFNPDINVTPRFLLLHTLSHLFIRQLEIEAGYPAASLKERIYCTAGEMPMSGILIYVAVPDIAGSLGGLVELAEPERFLPLLSSVFEHAEWCSLDPVCSEHEGQGPNLLNRAACHACALVPEPSCAYGNALLDRTFIKGDEIAGFPSFLDWVAQRRI